MSKMIDFGAGLEYYNGEVKIVSISENDKFKLKAFKDGVASEFTEDKALIRGLVASAGSASKVPERVDVTASDHPWKFDLQSGGPFIYSLIKKLPSSKELPVGMVCAVQLINVLEGIEQDSTKGHDLDSSSGGASEISLITEATLRLACAKLKTVMESDKSSSSLTHPTAPCAWASRSGASWTAASDRNPRSSRWWSS